MIKKIINFSGGRSSAYMLHELLKENNKDDLIIIFCNTSKETPETYEFLKDCVKHWQFELIVLEFKPKSFTITNLDNCKKNGEVFDELINFRKYMPNVVTRFCTTDMKIRICKRYLKSLNIKQYVNYLGIRADEPLRYSKIISRNSKNIYNDMPMYYNNITKKDITNFWLKQSFDLKHNSNLGNCDLCFLKGKNKIINILRTEPKKADWWIKNEELTGHTFKKDISYKTMLELSKRLEFNFDIDETEILCNCNLDD
jgi:3'-phosphoadenosine 5'-phosphosulfate sulfotransferase (PAPS reductase)/FAD synthetase